MPKVRGMRSAFGHHSCVGRPFVSFVLRDFAGFRVAFLNKFDDLAVDEYGVDSVDGIRHEKPYHQEQKQCHHNL